MYNAYIDGGARGNPGPAAYAAVLRNEAGAKIELSGYLGVQTNNVAEYEALIAALDHVVYLGEDGLEVFSDSMLVVKQIQGLWKVKDPALKVLNEKALDLIQMLGWFVISHIPRSLNKEADSLVNDTLDNVLDKDGKRGKGL